MFSFTTSPGYLVVVKSQVRGGVQYLRQDIRDERRPEGAQETEWKTTRIISNRKEYRMANKVRGKAEEMVRKFCRKTPFGLICLKDRLEPMMKAEEEAQAWVRAFNAEAQFSYINLWVMKGEIASDDIAAAKQIATEMRALARQMKEGIRNADVKAIREAAKVATQVKTMLSEPEQAKIGAAVKAAREAARKITKEVIGRGQDIAKILPELKLGAISKMRMAFLDLEDAPIKDDGSCMPEVNVKRISGVEIDEEVSDAV